MLEDRAGNLWVGVYDGLYLFKNGHFFRVPEPDHQPLRLVTGIAEEIDGDIWVEGLGRSQRLLRIHDFKVREQFSQPGHQLAADPHGGIWIARGTDLVLFRRGSVQKFPLNVSSPITQVMPEPDGSVLAATPDGLVGLRLGKVQRLGAKNGLPCDFVISAVEDKEKHWWLFTECGIVDFADSESRAMVGQSRCGTSRPPQRHLGRGPPRATIFQCSGFVSGRPRLVCHRGGRANGGPGQVLSKSATCKHVHRISHCRPKGIGCKLEHQPSAASARRAD